MRSFDLLILFFPPRYMSLLYVHPFVRSYNFFCIFYYDVVYFFLLSAAKFFALRGKSFEFHFLLIFFYRSFLIRPDINKRWQFVHDHSTNDISPHDSLTCLMTTRLMTFHLMAVCLMTTRHMTFHPMTVSRAWWQLATWHFISWQSVWWPFTQRLWISQ